MPKRILVVDDSNLLRNAVSRCLINAGHEVVGKGKDGDEAVDLYRRLRPDAVTLDITMRGKDGIAAAEEILQLDSRAVIIFYTLLDIPNLSEKTSRIGARNVIRKGDEEELLRALDAIA
ncbi:MAG: response regulator [Syntrophobacteraceae bacterium]|jgi:two-component system chemotaxis response regulator CheY